MKKVNIYTHIANAKDCIFVIEDILEKLNEIIDKVDFLEKEISCQKNQVGPARVEGRDDPSVET
jgi:hypothetical protein